ncbi:family 10 glycosylhydrolase, partial [bacterium]|nr:family 10 glycosylhydrolase [bacterium]
DSYRYCAKTKIKQVEALIGHTRCEYRNKNDKLLCSHLKKAKQKYKKSKKENSKEALNLAIEAQEEAQMAFRYSLPYLKDELKGVWIRPTSDNATEIQKTLDKIKEAGFDHVFLETYFHGRTIFPSKVMRSYGFEEQNPELKCNDVLGIWVQEAHKRNIKVHSWFESFYIGNKPPELYPKSILSVKPEWMNRTKQKADYLGYVSHPNEHNGYFLDPANIEVTTFLLKLIDEITTSYNVDGINIDYVRYPNIFKENYDNQWGYTPYARNEFKLVWEKDPIEITKDDELWEKWTEYRKDKITDYVKKVSELLRPKHVTFSIVIFPDYKTSVKTKFQDWSRWAYLGYPDAFTPLILTSDDSLSKSMLEEIRKKADDVKVYPGLFAGFIESDPEDLLKQIHIVRSLGLKGVVLFDWAHLGDNYLDVIKTSAFRAKDIK